MKKIKVHIGKNPLLDRLIQAQCFKAGLSWSGIQHYTDVGICGYGENYHLYAEVDGGKHMTYGSKGSTSTHKLLGVKEFLEALIVLNKVVYTLNSAYKAVITKDGVQVGCQKFTHAKVLGLAKEVEKFNKVNKTTK